VLEALEQGSEFPDRRLIFFGKLKKHSGVIYFRFKVFLSFNLLFEPAPILQKFLRGLLVVPEVRRGSLLLDLIQFFPARRDIKETSRFGRLALSNHQTWFSIPVSIKSHSFNSSQTPFTFVKAPSIKTEVISAQSSTNKSPCFV